MPSKLSLQGPTTISFRQGGGARSAVYGRGTARERGYDAEWNKLSALWRRTYPWCAECAQRGLQRRCDLVDHMVPIGDRPELRLDKENLWSLCKGCHDTTKRLLEAAARAGGDINVLPGWCRDPLTRPLGERYAPTRTNENRTSPAL